MTASVTSRKASVTSLLRRFVVYTDRVGRFRSDAANAPSAASHL